MPAPDASAAEGYTSPRERRAASQVSMDISRHLARVDVTVASFSSGSDSGSSSGDCDDSTTSVGDEGETIVRSSAAGVVGDDTAGIAAAETTVAAPAETARMHGRGGSSSGEFFVEPEWQRVPGRWAKFEDKLLREMKAELEEDLRAAPPFPEVIGSRRMLRFLR